MTERPSAVWEGPGSNLGFLLLIFCNVEPRFGFENGGLFVVTLLTSKSKLGEMRYRGMVCTVIFGVYVATFCSSKEGCVL